MTLEDLKDKTREEVEKLMNHRLISDELFYAYAKEWNKTPRFGPLMQEGPYVAGDHDG